MKNSLETRKTSKRVRQKERLIAALLHQPSLEQAAAAAGISVSTAYRMRQEPEFEEEYRLARRRAVSEGSALLQANCKEAASTLVAIMKDSKASAAYRIRAAQIVIEHATTKQPESEDIQARMQRLEQTIAPLIPDKVWRKIDQDLKRS
jgi:hypothetical protein